LAYQADRARIHIARSEYQAAVDLLAPVLAERDRGVFSERSYADAERAAMAYAQCRIAPDPELADRILEAVAAMRRTPPLPRMLMPQAEAWARDCAAT
jgi:hypothetical protein